MTKRKQRSALASSLSLSAACPLPLRSVWIVEPFQTDAGGNADFNVKRLVCVKFAAESKKKTLEPLQFQGFCLKVIISCCSFVANGVSAAVNWVSDRVDDVKDFFGLGDRGSYTGSVKEAVDVAKVLNDLKEKLSVEAENNEKKSIATIMQEFDRFTGEAKKKPEFKKLVEEIEQRKSKIQLNLAGTMMNHINKRLTANDPEFRKVLEMQPGDEKKQSLASYADKFNQEAEQKFRDKLKKEMDALRSEISEIFEAELSKQQRKLSEVEVAYQKLQYDAKNGQLNLKELEDACIPAMDAERCVKEIFQTGAVI